MEKYMIISPIGEGSFAKVYRGREKYTGRDVALKFISKLGKTEKDLYFLRREIDILRKMKHENIVDMINSFETNNEIVVVTERGLADLYQLLEDDVSLPEETVQKIACQLVSALYYLHSHRVLHRDMKPQNILIFPGGKVKLCDFGFARNMTMETMVLTSIKGTPLYMCPELVDEKPYDHSADLWALGCILYEVYHGKPPFFTNNVFHLIKMIGKESVKWPKPISSDMRNFLEGLLTKDSTQRLTWPDLLHHSFVRTGVKVPLLTESIIGPLTQPPTEEQRILKQQQIKAKGVSRGPSKLLSKFMPDEHRKDIQKSPGNKDKNQKKTKIPTIQNNEIETPLLQPPPIESKINQSTHIPDSLIIQEDKFVSSVRENVNTSILTNRTIDEQQIEQYAEQIEIITNEQLLNLLHQESFYKLFEIIQPIILSKLLECTLNGASFYRNMMKIIRFILQSDMDPHLIISFTNTIHIPDLPLKHLKAILDHSTIRKEPWFAHILYDILIVIRLWFELITAYTLQQLDEEQCKFYLIMSHEFLELTSTILNIASSLDYNICCETLMILIILCESYEDASPLLCQAWYDPIHLDKCQIWPAIAQLITTSFKSENSNIEIYNETLMYTVATMAALTYPSQCLPDELLEAKIKVANSLALKLLDSNYTAFREVWLGQYHTPKCCSNILKAMYGMCLSTPRFSAFIFDGSFLSNELLSLLRGQITTEESDFDEAIELSIHISTVLIKQIILQYDNNTRIDLRNQTTIKDDRKFEKLQPITAHIAQLAMTTQALPQRAACALHLVYAIACGAKFLLNSEEYIDSLSTIFVQSECDFIVRFPFNHGLLDGLIMLIFHIVQIDPQKSIGTLIDCGLFYILWQQLRAAFRSFYPNSMNEEISLITTPDWILISRDGIHQLLQLTLELFFQRMHKCLSLLIQSESVMFESLSMMLSKELTEQLDVKSSSFLTTEVITLTCNIFMFPFSIETSETFLERTLELCQRYDIIQKLLWVTMTYLSMDRIEVPVGLIAQLSYYQETARKTISQMLMNDVQLCQFYSNVLYGTNESELILCDTFFTFTNLIKTTDTVVSSISDILSGPKNDYDVLKRALSGSNLTKAKCCFLMGHMTKSSRSFCTTLKTHPDILDQLRQCCFEEDSHVRKMAFFLLGNFISTNEILYEYVDELTPFLVQALNDTISKIRSHAVNTLGFLARYRLSERLIELKVPEKLLDVACHDTHVTVQEFALRVLKQMLKYEQAKEILQECNVTDKLSNLLSNLCTQVENNQYSEVDGLVDECEQLLSMLIEQCT
ncbi:unnamed protein product [Rotaria sp. Silwood1]|nr:unnamed protein product [Rotaria sp. Silwood1]CAF1563018.1 unnamed protein product [Rotaria sp. Silwood1]